MASPPRWGPPDARSPLVATVQPGAVGPHCVSPPPLGRCLECTRLLLDADPAREVMARAPSLELDRLRWTKSCRRPEVLSNGGALSRQGFLKAAAALGSEV